MRAKRYGRRIPTGTKLAKTKLVRDTRSVLREHLRFTGKTTEHDLARAWNIQPNSAHRLMYDKDRFLSPEHIVAAVRVLKLCKQDAIELHTLAAIEAGWRLPLPEVL